jgi:hypothetical protein
MPLSTYGKIRKNLFCLNKCCEAERQSEQILLKLPEQFQMLISQAKSALLIKNVWKQSIGSRF